MKSEILCKHSSGQAWLKAGNIKTQINQAARDLIEGTH